MVLRELAGWLVTVVVWALPLAAPLTLGAWADGELPVGAVLLSGLSLLAVPPLWLLARRWREPARIEVAEADGRRPVLVLHAFERARTAWWQRALVALPGFWRDLAEHRLERALDRSLGEIGPVVHLTRPAPPPDHGPVALLAERAGWERDLEAALRAARLVAIVIDGTDANRHEIERAAAICGPSRVVLVTPPRLDPPLLARWESLRTALPGLPPLDPRLAAVRFDREVRPLPIHAPASTAASRRAIVARPEMLARPHERSGRPRAPLVSWLLSGLPILGAVVGAVLVPVTVDELGPGLSSSVVGGYTTILFVCAILLAVMSRRVMQLVPGSELPMVIVAATPWLGAELIGWVSLLNGASRLSRWLSAASAGAAYSVPLLVATAFVLAGASLIRKSPGRSVAFGAFGFAAIIPFAALYASLFVRGDRILIVLLALVPAALAIAVAAIAASGDAGRRHAPLSVGSAATAALAAAAVGCAIGHQRWRLAIRDAGRVVGAGADEVLGPLSAMGSTWPWFALAVPALVLVVASLFKGRATRVAGANALSLLPLVALVGLAVTADANAASRVGGVASGPDAVFASAGGRALDPGFEPVALQPSLPTSPGPVDLIVDRGGALAGGSRVSTAVDLASAGGAGAPAIGRGLGGVAPGSLVRLGVDPRASAASLHGAAQGAFAAGAGRVEIVGLAGGRPVSLGFGPPQAGPPDVIRLYLLLADDEVVLAATDGTHRTLSDVRGSVSPQLGQVLAERRRIDPAATTLGIAASRNVTVSRMMSAATLAQRHFPELTLEHPR